MFKSKYQYWETLSFCSGKHCTANFLHLFVFLLRHPSETKRDMLPFSRQKGFWDKLINCRTSLTIKFWPLVVPWFLTEYRNYNDSWNMSLSIQKMPARSALIKVIEFTKNRKIDRLHLEYILPRLTSQILKMRFPTTRNKHSITKFFIL